MDVLWWNFGSFLLFILSTQCYVTSVMSAWPSPSPSAVQLLGLFQYAENASQPTDFSRHSHTMFKAALLLAQQQNITIGGLPVGWHITHTDGNVIKALATSCQAVTSSNTVGIVGPTFSREAHQIAAFAATVGIPVVSYSATDSELSDRYTYPAFYRTVPADNTLTLAMVKLFARYNWTSCMMIYQNDAFGIGGARVVSDTFAKHDLVVRELLLYDLATLHVRGDLKAALRSSASRIVILWADATHTPRILQHALDADVLGPHFTWILTAHVPLDSFNLTHHAKLVGILSVEPVAGAVVDAPINSTLLNAAYQLWEQHDPESFPGPSEVNFYALFAFDATWALIQALARLCPRDQISPSSCTSFSGPSFCFDRRFDDAQSLFDTMNAMQFLGVSGPVEFDANVTDRMNGSYYYAQNVQYTSTGITFTPVLFYGNSSGWNTSLKTNLVVWPGNLLTLPTDRAMLAGVTLRIGVIESVPFTIVTRAVDAAGRNTTKLTGYVPDLIELLRIKMGFVADIRLTPSNQSYSQAVQAVADGDYDIVIGDVTVTSARREIAAFSNAISDNSLRIIMRKTPVVDVDLLSYMRPFSWNLWLLLLGALVLASVMLCLFERRENTALQNRSVLSMGALAVWFCYGTIVGYGADFHAQTAAGRLVSAGLYMLSLVLVASYTANLASDLTISKSRGVISGVDDLKNGKIPFHRIGIRVGTAGEDYYLREISGGSRSFYPLKSRRDMYDSLLAGIIDASLMDTGTAEYVTNNIYCNLTLVGDDFDKSTFGIVTPKQWLYAKDLDVNVLSLRETGALDALKKKWFQSSICSTMIETSTALGLESMSGLFLTFGVICVLSLVMYAWYNRQIIRDCLCMFSWRNTWWLKRESYEMNVRTKAQNSASFSSTTLQFTL